jgi:hypothetical protein
VKFAGEIGGWAGGHIKREGSSWIVLIGDGEPVNKAGTGISSMIHEGGGDVGIRSNLA